jgi:hypothetical protein
MTQVYDDEQIDDHIQAAIERPATEAPAPVASDELDATPEEPELPVSAELAPPPRLFERRSSRFVLFPDAFAGDAAARAELAGYLRCLPLPRNELPSMSNRLKFPSNFPCNLPDKFPSDLGKIAGKSAGNYVGMFRARTADFYRRTAPLLLPVLERRPARHSFPDHPPPTKSNKGRVVGKLPAAQVNREGEGWNPSKSSFI